MSDEGWRNEITSQLFVSLSAISTSPRHSVTCNESRRYVSEACSYKISVRRRRKKHRLVVEVESLVSSSKKITTPRREDGVVVVDKNVKSRRTFNKNSSDLLTGYSNNAH